MWAPVGPQLGKVGPKWAPDGPDWGLFGNAAWVVHTVMVIVFHSAAYSLYA